MDNIAINLRNNRQKDAVFRLSIMLINMYIINKRNLTSFEQTKLEILTKSVYKRIYDNEIGWVDKYLGVFNSFASSDKPISEVVFDIVKNGIYDISEKESEQITGLLTFIQMYLPLIIKGGNENYLFELKQAITHTMLSLGIL